MDTDQNLQWENRPYPQTCHRCKKPILPGKKFRLDEYGEPVHCPDCHGKSR